MFLLKNTPHVHNDPFPHFVIDNALPEDVASYMLDNFPDAGPSAKEQKYNQVRGGYKDDAVFASFESLNDLMQDDIFELVDDAFTDFTTDQYTLSDFTYRKEPPQWPPVLLKDWHIDQPNKKYHAMVYLGDGDGGWLEMRNDKRNIEKRYEYTHNRLIMWRNDADALHRFWTSNNSRHTIGFAVQYV